MNANASSYRDIGDVDFRVWQAELANYPSSPLIPIAPALYAICKGHTANRLRGLPVIGKVEIRKVTKVFERSAIIRPSRILCGTEVPQSDPLVLESNTGHPSLPSAVERNALEPTGIARRRSTIRSILRIGRTAQVLSPVVQPIAVPVVNFDFAFSTNDEPMKQDEGFAISPARVPAARVALHGGPLMGQHAVRVSGVNDGYFALGKGNQNEAGGGRIVRHSVPPDWVSRTRWFQPRGCFSCVGHFTRLLRISPHWHASIIPDFVDFMGFLGVTE